MTEQIFDRTAAASRPTVATSGFFADASNFELRLVTDYDKISEIVAALRVLGLRVVLTSGTFDILHEGHSMYLEAARQFGDFLIVGWTATRRSAAARGCGARPYRNWSGCAWSPTSAAWAWSRSNRRTSRAGR
ncbi:adenylyltransferase/cytidyltransferase family protein [Plantactinospora sp. KBS50]|uniref:adenylyltransferase/cytidyltransferase family protein n=1 Tax=Plantactinospora sp. KBS50 TaxID=2024580 RepID=UPI0012FD234B|nr:adenylyltransferase/cytidyltransferase family protein [Plantactinospora sp. KBS50]